ncbi:LptF/LptG family permease [Helicobacter sp. 11S03491-1]|uniref:LptF/LptG family permease n=1 Tax=Helicobacter sp. 11S03491-1 TaxID=1476196 RepID=UPI000BA728B8|nr:LptF/LptG family permease [Helicobacter sp. 11S03491-1]PAF41819.1 permease [Helicobacter sp. 11S03491-1]
MIKKYIFLAVSQIFFPFFLVLFFIASVVLLISIAGVTLVVKMNVLDLGQLFLYSLPGTVFFIIPITFFAACVLGLSRLSYDYELLVFFSLGISPKKILKIFIPISLLVSVVLLMFSLAMIPLSKSAYSDFIAEKKNKVDINIRPGEFGQKLGDWLVYVNKAHSNHYNQLVLFSSDGLSQESFIVADSGEVDNNGGVFELTLHNGDAYFAQNSEIKKIDFKQMILKNEAGALKLNSYDLISYWKSAFKGDTSQARRFSQAIMTSVFPLVSIFLIPLFGIANPRFHKNMSYVYILLSVGIYFLIMHITSQNIPFWGLIFLPILWLIGSYWLYRRFVLKFY